MPEEKNHECKKGVFLNYIEDHEKKILKISKISRILTKTRILFTNIQKIITFFAVVENSSYSVYSSLREWTFMGKSKIFSYSVHSRDIQ